MVSLATGGKRYAHYAINETISNTKKLFTSKQTNMNSVGTHAINNRTLTCEFL